MRLRKRRSYNTKKEKEELFANILIRLLVKKIEIKVNTSLVLLIRLRRC